MTLDKHEQQVVEDAVVAFETERDFYCAGTTQRRYAALAHALRAILPKPRFYVNGRYVYDRHDRVIFIDAMRAPDDAIAALIAQDIADVLNKRLGEESS